MLLGGLPVPPPQPLPHEGLAVRGGVSASGSVGIEIPPALPPPRAAPPGAKPPGSAAARRPRRPGYRPHE
jgi:hypothetical protein